MKHAATSWQKFDSDTTMIGQPQEGEWCLWTMEIQGQRNYFTGSWRMRERIAPYKKEPWIYWQGGPSYPMNDTVYWARVIHLEI